MPRRLTDRSLPPGLSSISPDANLFDELMEMEKRLDWTMTRRRQEITDTLNRGTLLTKRTLRIFMSHSVKNQSWQQSATSDSKAETAQDDAQKAADGENGKTTVETGASVPSWTFKIEGKLLQPPTVPTPKRWPVPKRQFSQLVRSIAIEMDRDPSLYADTNHVQWMADPRWINYNLLGVYPSIPPPSANAPADAAATNPLNAATPLDGFTVMRTGDTPTVLRITIHLNHYPERIKLAPHLAAVLGIHEDTRNNILGAFWHYVKAHGLQDKNDRKLIRMDDKLRTIFKYESLNFQDIQVLLASHLQPADPIVLHYEIGTHCVDSSDVDMADSTASAIPAQGGIGVNKDGQSAIKAFDVELDMDDLWMRAKAGDAVMNMQPEAVALGLGVAAPPSGTFVAVQKADDEIKLSLQNLRSLRIRRDFFTSLAEQPSQFIQKFVESQSRDLEVVLGNERAAEGAGAGGNASFGSGVDGGIRESDLMKSEFFEGDWVYEAVGVHEGIRMGGAVAAMHHAQHAQVAHMHQNLQQQQHQSDSWSEYAITLMRSNIHRMMKFPYGAYTSSAELLFSGSQTWVILSPPKMSRLIIKNLPLYITETKLREHLSTKPQPGELTDVRIVHKKNGSTRRIAFIGYKTEKEAQSAREYFDRSYLDISKLKVETVTGTKDVPTDDKKRKRPQKEDAGDENRETKRQKLDTRSSKGNVKESSPGPAKKKQKDKLGEFQKVMGAKTNSHPSWAADVEPSEGLSTSAMVKESSRDIDSVNVGGKEDQEPEEVSDMEWMRRRMLASEIKADREFEQSDDERAEVGANEEEAKVQIIEEKTEDPITTSILSNGRLFVRNLVFTCTEDELRGLFTRYGDIDEIHIPLDASSSPKGFAYVRFKDPSLAVAAHQALDGTSFQGRLIHILPAVDRNPRPKDDTNNNKTARLRDVRAHQKKENSGKDFNWAVLYMNSDAVANSIAERLGIPKTDILNPDGSTIGGSPAVKLALAETHIITETKKYLEQHNVDLSLFSRPRIPRSKTIILVKNIPYGTTSAELSEMFGTFGKIKRVLLPPAGTIAIVEFPSDHESEASNAWKGLAYKRLKDSVLYLEWAPEGLFDGVAPLNVSEPALKQSQSATDKTQPPDTAVDHSDEENAPPGATLYIGNLSFATTSARLSSLFRHLPSFAFAKVATKADPKKPGELLSQGFGFVGFKDVDAAKKAMKGFGSGGDGLVLDGHVLKVSFAGRGKEEAEAGAGILSKEGKGKATKIIVKNLAFEVSKKELWELFSTHAQVKSVRLPNRADRRSRGFAFVDFATRKEAENAMDRLKHTHLLGRHLVMEWAEKEKGVEEMRLKTMLQFGDGAEGTTDLGRKDKLRLGLGAEVDSDVE